MIKLKFNTKWKTKTGTSYTFDTYVPIWTDELTQGNQEICSTFRVDIPDSFVTGEIEVYIIGDSTEQGFLVCEEVTHIFDEIELEAATDIVKDHVLDIQEEYDEWLIEYENGDR